MTDGFRLWSDRAVKWPITFLTIHVYTFVRHKPYARVTTVKNVIVARETFSRANAIYHVYYMRPLNVWAKWLWSVIWYTLWEWHVIIIINIKLVNILQKYKQVHIKFKVEGRVYCVLMRNAERIQTVTGEIACLYRPPKVINHDDSLRPR